MGYQVRKTVYTLVIDDGDFAGCEVKVRGRSVREVLVARDMSWENDTSIPWADKEKRYREFYGDFIADVISWDLESDREPIPVTLDAFLDLDEAFAMALCRAWLYRKVAPDAPLNQPSSGGEQFPEDSIPMETSSPSLAS